MVQIKLKDVLFFLITFAVLFTSCDGQSPKVNNTKGQVVGLESISDDYCFKTVRDSLFGIIDFHKQEVYYSIEYQKLKKDSKDNLKQFDDFIEFSSDVESFLIETKKDRVLILIGKALGASGMGVNYWNYCFGSIENEKNRFQFISLVKTPYSVFFDKSEKANYIELTDNIPRPADGKKVTLDHFPLIVSAYDANDKKNISFEYKCKN